MKISILIISLFISAAGFSQSRDFDFELKIDNYNSIFLNGQKISKHTLKEEFRSFKGQQPTIQLKWSQVVVQSRIEKIKRIASKAFETTYIMEFDFPAEEKVKKYQYVISGTVKNTNDQPLKNTAVVAKGTRTGILTDQNGYFKLGIPAETESLVVQHKDFKTFELPCAQLAGLKNTEAFVITLTAK